MPVLQDYEVPSVVAPTSQLSVQIDLPYDFHAGTPLQVFALRIATGDTVLVRDGVDGQSVAINPTLGHVITTNPFYPLTPVENIEFRVARVVTPLQEFGGTNNDVVDIRDIVASLDRSAQVLQQLHETLHWYRGADVNFPDPITFYRPVISPDPLILPGQGGRQSRLLGFDADGNTNLVEYTAFIETLLDDPDAATARATLEAASQAQVDDIDGRITLIEDAWDDLGGSLAGLWTQWSEFIGETWPAHLAGNYDHAEGWIEAMLEWLNNLSNADIYNSSLWIGTGWVDGELNPVEGLSTFPQIQAHIESAANPHQVTPAQIGAATEGSLSIVAALAGTNQSDIADVDNALAGHLAASNPHGITPAGIGTMTTAEINAAIAAGGGGATLGDILAALDAAASPYAITLNDDPWAFPRVRSAAGGGWEAGWRTAAEFRSDISAQAGSAILSGVADTFPNGTHAQPRALTHGADRIPAYAWEQISSWRPLLGLESDFVAIGNAAAQSGTWPVALGRSASASANYASAIGAGATASGIRSSAIGQESTASHLRSTAIGQQAATTAADQIRLGKAGQVVSVPGDAAIDGDLTAASVAAQTATWIDLAVNQMRLQVGTTPVTVNESTLEGLGKVEGPMTAWATGNLMFGILPIRPGEVIDQVRVVVYQAYPGDEWMVEVKSRPIDAPNSPATTHADPMVTVASYLTGAEAVSLSTPVTAQAGRVYYLKIYPGSAYYGGSSFMRLYGAGARVQGRVL